MTQNLTFFILEDDILLAKNIASFLEEKLHCHLLKSATIKDSFFLLEKLKNPPDLFLLDLYLQNQETGIDFVTFLKQKYSPLPPFIFFSSDNNPLIKEQCFDLGACDYLTKPFSLKELLYRLEKLPCLQRPSQKLFLQEWNYFSLKISFVGHFIEDLESKKKIPLGTKETQILQLLLNNLDTVVSRDHIIDMVWGENSFPSARTVDNYIVTLRKIFSSLPKNDIEIRSIRGIGYQFLIPHHEENKGEK